MFSLAEDLLLLALDPEGRIHHNSLLNYGLAGAILGDLLLAGAIRLEDGKAIPAAGATGDDVLDRALAEIRGSEKPRSLGSWISRLAESDPRARTLASLAARGIVHYEEHRVLWVFPRRLYPADHPETERDMAAEVRAAGVADVPPDPRMRILLGLARAAHLDLDLWANGERERARRNIREWTLDEPVSRAVHMAVDEMESAAAMVTFTAAVVP